MKLAEVRSEIVGAVAILLFRGRLTAGAGDAPLETAIARALDAGYRHLILDFSEATAVDSVGIGALITGLTNTVLRKGKLDLCSLPPILRDVLSVSQLNSVFRISDSKEEALRAALMDAAAGAGASPS